MSLRIIVSGMVAATPGQGGATWAVLQYLLGLRRLGHDVFLVEPVDALDERADWCASIMARHGFDENWCLVGPNGATAGLVRRQLDRLGRDADVLLNVSGMLTEESILTHVPVRAYLDLDPAFVQLWHEAEGVDMRFDAHTHFVSVSDSIGRTIPSCGHAWIPTLPPVVLAEWPVADAIVHDGLTTVANWRSYGSLHHNGIHYGQKAHSLRPLLDLPSRTDLPLILALGIHADESEDLAALAHNGWQIIDPDVVAGTPDDYRRFIQGSTAELGIVKSGYVVSDSGWFSDRSACYLASGRPVIAQDTGFGRRLPAGQGLLEFTTAADAALAAASVRGEYPEHRQAARAIAEEHLDSDVVLGALLDRLAG